MSGALAKIHIAKKELAMQEDAYRDLLERVTGQRTAKGLSNAQADHVIAEFKRLGWTPTSAKGKPKLVVDNKKDGKPQQAKAPKLAQKLASSPSAKKARALWISLYQLGVVRDRSESALEAFALQRAGLGVAKLQWADEQMMFKLIEALKHMSSRNGWLVTSGSDIAVMRSLVKAQCRKLGMGEPTDLGNYSIDLLRVRASNLGEQIRAKAEA